MRKRLLLTLVAIMMAIVFTACGDNNNNDEELKTLDVEFEVPEQIDVGETLELEAFVTYGDEPVTDADEVEFEVWEKNDQDNSTDYPSENNGDGTYTVEVTFDHDGVFEMYAHTTAHDLHTMPLREITVGEGGDYDEDGDDHSFDTEGFDMHFMGVEDGKAGVETDLVVHVMINEEHLADAKVRYEIWTDEDEDNRDWIDATETDEEYVANHTFDEQGTYNIQIHVEDDEDLHEHAQETVEINE